MILTLLPTLLTIRAVVRVRGPAEQDLQRGNRLKKRQMRVRNKEHAAPRLSSDEGRWTRRTPGLGGLPLAAEPFFVPRGSLGSHRASGEGGLFASHVRVFCLRLLQVKSGCGGCRSQDAFAFTRGRIILLYS